MDIDEQLINQNTDNTEADKAGKLREAKRGGPAEESETGTSLREQVQLQRGREAEKETTATNQLSGKTNPLLELTDRLLKGSWENLIASWGLTLIWIDIHAFLNKVFGPSVFRDLGDEWIPNQIKKSPVVSKAASSSIKIAEKAGVGCLNLGCLFLIILVLSIITIIYSVIENPLGSLYGILKNSSVSDFLSLIKSWW